MMPWTMINIVKDKKYKKMTDEKFIIMMDIGLDKSLWKDGTETKIYEEWAGHLACMLLTQDGAKFDFWHRI